uniref:40S ribosomal protein SA n=1 Tax=Arundo donax TaxID=35708 RepID=A0A0A9CQ35_ARUDO
MRGTILPGHKWDVMVDLFFYRDPEEAKELEEEEAPVAPDYTAVAEYGAPTTDTWGNDQWGAAEAPAAALPGAPVGTEWGAALAPVAAEGWDSAAVPPAAAPAATGWEEGSVPAPTGWQ